MLIDEKIKQLVNAIGNYALHLDGCWKPGTNYTERMYPERDKLRNILQPLLSLQSLPQTQQSGDDKATQTSVSETFTEADEKELKDMCESTWKIIPGITYNQASTIAEHLYRLGYKKHT